MDLWTEFLGLVSQVVTPIWSELIQYIPLLLFFLMPLVVLLVLWMWRHNSSRNRSRVPSRLPDGRAPADLHLPSPSPWPLVGAAGGFFLLFSLVTGSQSGPNLLFLAIGLGIGGLALVGWLWDARKEYDAVEAGDHHLLLAPETAGRTAYDGTLPPGIHLPAPSAWPFFAPIGLFFTFLGLVLGPVLIIAGLLMAFIAMIGWLLDAGREYRDVETGAHHDDPAARDPERIFPKLLPPVYGIIGIMAIVLTMAPWMLTWLPKTEEVAADAGSTPTTTPYVSATSVVEFVEKEITVPADTPFTITFDNKQAGVDHNIEIFSDAAKTQVYYDGEIITGPATIDYPIDPMAAGVYPFICKVHPVTMVGTLSVE
jgi:plastocyanin